MNRRLLIVITLAAWLALGAGLPNVQAAATNFSSTDYGIESVIIGGTGTLRSDEAVTAPVIVSGPTVQNATGTDPASRTTYSTITWVTDKESTSEVSYRLATGSYGDFPVQVNESSIARGKDPNAPNYTHTVVLQSLRKNLEYYYKVRSTDQFGNQTVSAEQRFLSETGDVVTPKLLGPPHITINSASSIKVDWETDENSNTLVEYGATNVEDNTTGKRNEQTTFHSVTIENLVPSKKYLLRVTSTDISENRMASDIMEVTTLNAPAITEVKVTDITLSTAIVQWKTSSPTKSQLKYGTKAASYDKTVPDETYSQNHLVKLDGLQSGTTYYLRIFGEDQSKTVLSSDEYVFQTVIVPIISDLKVSEITSSSAKVTWKSSSDIDEIISYQIVKSDDKRSLGKRFSAGNDKLASNHSYVLEDLESGSTYMLSTVGKDVFGNQAVSPTVLFTVLPDKEPPVIQQVKVDTSVDLGSKQSVQVLVSFGLNEPGLAYLEYGGGANGPYDKKVTTDEEVGSNKFMVIPGLTPGESYHFRIQASDRAGNAATSADYLVLAPSQPVNLYDLIFAQIRQNFGWLQKIGN